jgi:hypothetical protein
MCLRIPFSIHFRSGRLHFVKKVIMVVPYYAAIPPCAVHKWPTVCYMCLPCEGAYLQ